MWPHRDVGESFHNDTPACVYDFSLVRGGKREVMEHLL